MMAGLIQKTKLGNCGEQSAVAFKYLITRGAPGLAIVDWRGGNHTFVVIGMDPGVPDISKATLMIPPTWGKAAVVCDPWYHEWFSVESLDDWQSKMKRIVADTSSAPRHKIERDAAVASGDTTPYAKTMVYKWEFARLAYLPHPVPDLTNLACTSGIPNPLKEQTRATSFRGHAL